jgi:hypothetical protein
MVKCSRCKRSHTPTLPRMGAPPHLVRVRVRVRVGVKVRVGVGIGLGVGVRVRVRVRLGLKLGAHRRISRARVFGVCMWCLLYVPG